MEDPPSLLVDYHSPWQIPDSPLISEEPINSAPDYGGPSLTFDGFPTPRLFPKNWLCLTDTVFFHFKE